MVFLPQIPFFGIWGRAGRGPWLNDVIEGFYAMKHKATFTNRMKQNWLFILLSALFAIWALAFIYHSSYAAIDDRRYFNLFDDAMISMRYAWNFSHGRGLYRKSSTPPSSSIIVPTASSR